MQYHPKTRKNPTPIGVNVWGWGSDVGRAATRPTKGTEPAESWFSVLAIIAIQSTGGDPRLESHEKAKPDWWGTTPLPITLNFADFESKQST